MNFSKKTLFYRYNKEDFLKIMQNTPAFFGGSFDPPHPGHLAVAHGALASGKCSHVIWVPAFAPPHKLNAERAPFADRMAMIGLIIKEENSMSVSDIESHVEQRPTYSITILEAMEKSNGIRPALLIGSDSLCQLHTWHRAEELVKNYTILTYPRKDAPVSEELLREHWSLEIVQKLLAGVIPGEFFEISSTEIRKSMEKTANEGNIKYMTKTFPEVDAYIREHRLYGKSQTKDDEL